MATDKELCENLRSLSVDDPDRILRPADFDRLKLNRKELFDSLISILTSEEEDLTIRKQAVDFIRCIICDAIDSDNFRSSIPWFMQKLMDAGVAAGDPLQEYILKAFCQICRSKKEKFVPYIDGLIDSILVDLEISELQPVSDDVKDMVILSTADGKKTGLKKSEVKKMIRAVDFLSTFIKILGVQFGKHVVAAGNSLVPLLSFPFDIDIKRSILSAIAELFIPACEWSTNNPLGHLSLSQWVEKVVTNVLKDLPSSRDDAGKIDLDLMLAETRGLNKCLRNAGPKVLKHKQLGDLCEKVFALMGESSQRCVKSAADEHHAENGYHAENGFEGPEYVEESNDRLEEKGSEQALRSTLREINAAVMMFHWDMYTSGEEWCGKFIVTHLDPNCAPNDRALALYICGDVIYHLNFAGYWPRWLPYVSHLVEFVGDPHPGVRRAAVELFRPARELTASSLLALLSLRQWVEKVVKNVLKNLTPGGAGKIDLDLMLAEARCLNKVLRDVGARVLNDELLGDVCEKVFALMGESSQRCVKSAADKHQVQNGVVGPEYVQSDSERALRSTLRELNVAVMKFHSDQYAFSSGAKWCSEFINAHLESCIPVDRALALYVWDDVREHIEVDIFELKGLKRWPKSEWPTFKNHVIESLSDPHPGVRRAAAFGLIRAAEQARFPDDLIQKAANKILVSLRANQSQEEDFLSATDFMVAALNAILQHRYNQPLPEQFVLPWINNLPLKVDDEEGRRVHGYFVGQLFTYNQKGKVEPRPDVVGPNNENFPRLAAICASIYRTDFSTAKIDEQIRKFITHFGFNVTSSVGADFDKELQKGLKRIYRDLNWA